MAISDEGVSVAGPSPVQEESGRPTVGGRVAEFREEYPGIASLPVSETDGRLLRREATEPERVTHEVAIGDDEYGDDAETVRLSQVTERRAVTWAEAIELFLESHESYRDASLRLGRGREGREGYESFEVSLTDAWGRAYADKEYAKSKALERSIEREWSEFSTVMLTFTASSTPGGERLPPVDHLRAILDTWTEYVYQELRNTMRAAGYDRDEWVFWVQGEPHPGEGANACYGHVHVAVYVDGEPDAELFHSVVDKHVEECGPARTEAHGYETAISVNGDVDNIGSYMAAYAGNYGGDLLERPIEYLAWGALHWVTNSQRARRSGIANDAIRADACRQRYENPEAGQEHNHGERVRDDNGYGPDWVCAACGSSWGIPQPDDETESGSTEAGDEVDMPPPRGSAARWPDADAVARAGETPTERKIRRRVREYVEQNPDATETKVMGALGLPPPPAGALRIVRRELEGDGLPDTESFERSPTWRAEAVVRGEEEHPVSRAGGVDLVPLKLPKRGESSLWDRPEGMLFRCAECDFGTYESDVMKRHVTARGCLSDGDGYADVVEYEPVSGTPDPRNMAVGGSVNNKPVQINNNQVEELSDDGLPQAEARRRVREAVAEIAGEEPASVDAIRERVAVEVVEHHIEKLAEKGVIYEAADGAYRLT